MKLLIINDNVVSKFEKKLPSNKACWNRAGIFTNKSWERLVLQSLMELLPHDSCCRVKESQKCSSSSRLRAERKIAKQAELEFEAFFAQSNLFAFKFASNSNLKAVRKKLSEHFKFSFLFIIFGARAEQSAFDVYFRCCRQTVQSRMMNYGKVG